MPTTILIGTVLLAAFLTFAFCCTACGEGDRNAWLAASPAQSEYSFTVTDPATGTSNVVSSPDPRFEITPHRETYPGSKFVRRWVTLTNRSSAPIVITEASIESFTLAVDTGDLTALYGLARTKQERWPVWFDLHTEDLASGKPIAFDTGRWSNATWLMLSRKSAPQGLVIGWETYAPTQCRLDAQRRVTVSLRPNLTLAPGETFETPKSFTGAYEGDTDDGCYATQRFVEEHLAWPLPDKDFPYLMFNSWGYERAIHDSLAREAIDLCAKLGVELFVADFGWEGPDWLPLPEAFPNGLAPLADLCHAHKMKFGAHLSFGNVSEKAQMYKDHPDWVHGEGYWAYGQGKFPVHALSLGLPEARAWIVDKVVEVLDREKIEWFLTDSHLWGHVDATKHKVLADQDYLAADGFEKTLAEIHKRRPKVLIEHCDGGLSLTGYRMFEQHVTSIACDNANAMDTRLSVYDLSHFMPPRYLDKYQQEWRSHYANRSCMFGGPWILMMPINKLEPGSRDWTELMEDVAIYKRYRARIRDGKVLHLVKPGVPTDASWDGWDAIGSYNLQEDAAIVFAFRTRGDLKARSIPMKGLRPQGRYKVTLVDEKRSYTAAGEEIMRSGFPLELSAYAEAPQSHCSEIILVEPEA